jgi:Sec-independent protein translocase protein TatA
MWYYVIHHATWDRPMHLVVIAIVILVLFGGRNIQRMM